MEQEPVLTRAGASGGADPVRVWVEGPDATSLSRDDLSRLFTGRALSAARRERLVQSPRVVAAVAGRVVGVMGYDHAHHELRVHEFGLDAELVEFGPSAVVDALFEAVELASIAAGVGRVVVIPRAVRARDLLVRRGYTVVNEGCAGAWLEKTVLALPAAQTRRPVRARARARRAPAPVSVPRKGPRASASGFEPAGGATERRRQP